MRLIRIIADAYVVLVLHRLAESDSSTLIRELKGPHGRHEQRAGTAKPEEPTWLGLVSVQ